MESSCSEHNYYSRFLNFNDLWRAGVIPRIGLEKLNSYYVYWLNESFLSDGGSTILNFTIPFLESCYHAVYPFEVDVGEYKVVLRNLDQRKKGFLDIDVFETPLNQSRPVF